MHPWPRPPRLCPRGAAPRSLLGRPRHLARPLRRPLHPHLLPRHRGRRRSEEHTSELQSRLHLVCRLLLEKKKKHMRTQIYTNDHRPNSNKLPLVQYHIPPSKCICSGYTPLIPPAITMCPPIHPHVTLIL